MRRRRKSPAVLCVVRVRCIVCVLGCAAAGCQPAGQGRSAGFPRDQLDPSFHQALFPGLDPPVVLLPIEAEVMPPAGWRADPLKSSDKHAHQVWISPSGNTAFGVIRFKLPLPVGPDLALRFGFLPEMKKAEGEARLLSSRSDPDLPGLRFVAEGGLYRLRASMITRGWRGWAIYAGTLRDQPVMPGELALAELARDSTAVGISP